MACGFFQVYCFAYMLIIATCQLWVWWHSDDEAINVTTAPDSSPDLREEPELRFPNCRCEGPQFLSSSAYYVTG